jgi:glutamate decarboxylase
MSKSYAMSVHRKHDLGTKLLDVIHGSADLSQTVPKYTIPRDERSARDAYSIIHDELLLEGNARQNLATFCTTWMEPEVQQLMAKCIDKNMCDKDECPQTAEIESRCVHILADLWNSPATSNSSGCSTTGSSEAAMLGGLPAKWRWRTRMRGQGKSTDRPNLVCGSVQVCWHKFGRYFDVEIREVPMEAERFLRGPEQVLARCDENTIMVVPTLGVTMCCQFEPVQAIAQALHELESNSGLDIPIRVDAASGGFLAPFCDRLRTRGWQVPAYSMPPNREDLVVQRILVRHGVSRDLTDLLLEDIHRSLELLEEHPVSRHLTQTEAGGYNHSGGR